MSSSNDMIPHGPSAMLLQNLSFRDSLDPEVFAEAAIDCAVEYANLLRPEGSVVALTTTAVRSFCERNLVKVGLDRGLQKRFSEGGLKWARKGTDRTAVVSELGGKYAGQATQVSGGFALAGAAATGVLIAVEIAHLIADADMARLQRETIEKLSKLEAYHDIEQETKLEQLYFKARTILSNAAVGDIRSSILDVRSQLHELRIRWRRESEHNLTQISDSRNSGWFANIRSGQESRDHQTAKQISAELKKFILIDYALRLDHVLGLASGTWQTTRKTTEDELTELKRLGDVLRDKCYYISDKRRHNVMLIQKSVAEIPAFYTQLLYLEVPMNQQPLLLEFDNAGH